MKTAHVAPRLRYTFEDNDIAKQRNGLNYDVTDRPIGNNHQGDMDFEMRDDNAMSSQRPANVPTYSTFGKTQPHNSNGPNSNNSIDIDKSQFNVRHNMPGKHSGILESGC